MLAAVVNLLRLKPLITVYPGISTGATAVRPLYCRHRQNYRIARPLISFYADDTQPYIFGKPDTGNVDSSREATANCIDEVALWLCSNRLHLNQSKTKFVWCTTRRRLQLLDNSPIQLGTNASVVPSTKVRNLGVFIDQ